MKKSLLLLTLVLLLTNVQAQSLSSLIKNVSIPATQAPCNETIENARAAVVQEDFDKALYIYNVIIDRQKQERQQGSQVSNEIMAEYAYVLALTGAQEAAIINLDLAINLKWPTKTVYYYIASILDIIGFQNLSQPFERYSRQPTWLNYKGAELNKKYRSPILLSIDRTDTAISHISQCIGDSRLIEALCYSTYLTQLAPDNQSAWLLQSTVYEKMECYTLALESYERGLNLSPEDKDRPEMTKQLSYLQKKSKKKGNFLNLWQGYQMIYCGVSFNDGNTSLNAREGLSSGPFSISFNESFNVSKHGQCSFYAGLSLFHNFHKLFYGLGLGYQIANSSTFSLSPTIGVSFPNAKRTSSIDVSIEYNIPCKSGMSSTFGISIGKTLYFKSKSKGKSK